MHMKIDGRIYDADAIREMEAQAECAADEITRLRAALDAMTAERDDADRRAGAAERENEHLRESKRAREAWLREAKARRGYHDSVSFDRVWSQTCELADRTVQAEAERDAERAKARAKALEDALATIAALPAGLTEEVMEGQEQAYRAIEAIRADAPLTPAEAMARCPEVAALVTLLSEARSDLAASVDAEYPPDTCKQYPDMAKRHHRDMDLCHRIDAALATFATS